jgi:hypothetical protein
MEEYQKYLIAINSTILKHTCIIHTLTQMITKYLDLTCGQYSVTNPTIKKLKWYSGATQCGDVFKDIFTFIDPQRYNVRDAKLLLQLNIPIALVCGERYSTSLNISFNDGPHDSDECDSLSLAYALKARQYGLAWPPWADPVNTLTSCVLGSGHLGYWDGRGTIICMPSGHNPLSQIMGIKSSQLPLVNSIALKKLKEENLVWTPRTILWCTKWMFSATISIADSNCPITGHKIHPDIIQIIIDQCLGNYLPIFDPITGAIDLSYTILKNTKLGE